MRFNNPSNDVEARGALPRDRAICAGPQALVRWPRSDHCERMSGAAACVVEGDRAKRFRFSRSGLPDGVESLEEVARHLIGLQAQDLSAAGLAASARCAASSHADVADRLYVRRSLVKLWGQRNTLHLYASEDWPLVFGAFGHSDTSFERSVKTQGVDLEAFRCSVDEFIVAMAARDSFGYGDLEVAEFALGGIEVAGWSAGWGDLALTVARRGPVCHAEPVSGRSRFAHRNQWLPELAWRPPTADIAGSDLARRYLATYGPATEEDLAHWSGMNRTVARRWLTDLGDDVVQVSVDDAPMQLLANDIDHLQSRSDGDARWVRLLGKYDPMLLAHKNKDWIVDPANRARVWRSGGRVEAVVLVNGQIAGTWRYKRKTHAIDLTIAMFRTPSAWAVGQLDTETRRIANHFDLQLGEVAITTEETP